MTEVAFNGHEVRFPDTMDPFASLPRLGSAPRIEMMANPDFVFPRTAPSPGADQSLGANRRPQSFHANHSGRSAPEHRRAKSTMPLPSFSFNAADSTGLRPDAPQVGLTNELAPPTPSRGHKRTTSEFVGGDSRLLASAAVISPLTTASQPLQISNRPNHRHRRSAAISSHDVRDIMSPPEPMPRLSSSAPNSPMEELPRPVFGGQDVSASSSEDESSTRPPSRRQVEFSDTVEFIPRPLSTISSGTEGSYSTARGHSVNNSISSMLSLGTPSPPVNRVALIPLETTLECEPSISSRSSLEISRRVEKEGQWLKCSPRDSDIQMAESPTTTISFADPESPIKPRPSHRAKDSRQLPTEIERRRSEPTVKTLDEAGLSNLQTTKSQDPAAVLAADSQLADRRSSTRKLKDWAMSKMVRTPGKKHARGQSEIVSPFRSGNRNSRFIPEPITIPAPVAETDLDAVFGGPTSPRAAPSTVYSRLENLTPTFTPSASQSSLGRSTAAEDEGFMLDLDAALGPFQTPTMGMHKQRREMHSSRLNRDFTGPGGHYLPNPNHRRTESAPMLTPFDHSRLTTPTQPVMADVFEEDEEEDSGRRASAQSLPEDEAAVGIQIVDADVSAPPSRGLGARSDEGAEWEPDRPSPSVVSYLSSGLSTPTVEHRPSSIVEETIMEEPSPVEPVSPLEPVQIVPDYEEPRAPSFTKSSDSSETPTLLGGTTTIPNRPMTSPEYTAYGSGPPPFAPPPELLCGRGQSSFDTPRVGTSASSVTTADGRTMSSYATGEGSSSEPRRSVDDVPSLTSSRSTMLSTMQAFPRREGSESRPPYPALNARAAAANVATYAPSMAPSSPMDDETTASRRRKRQSIQSLSQLVGVASFGGGARSASMTAASSASLNRPQTADVLGGRFRTSPSPPQSSSSLVSSASTRTGNRKPVEHRLKKLMFWKSKSRQSLNSLAGGSEV